MRSMPGEYFPALNRAIPEFRFTADDVNGATNGTLIDGKRQAPIALLGDHPIIHVGQPIELSVKAEAGVPGNLASDIHHRLPEIVHSDEPLVDEAEHQIRVAAPADRVAVPVLLGAIEMPFVLEVFGNGDSDFVHVLAAEQPEAIAVNPELVDR